MARRKGSKPTVEGWQKTVEAVEKKERPANVVVSAKTPGQKKYIQEIQNNDIVFCSGPAGSGKTVVAAGLALQALLTNQYQKIIILRPAVEACDEKIGFLPGSASEKMELYSAPVFDNMEVFLPKPIIKRLIEEEKIEVIPLGFIRGRSFNNAFIIVDESQNISCPQMLLVLTRLGHDSKMVFNGDLRQSDLRGRNGLEDAFTRLQGVDGISFAVLTAADIVRHRLIGKILDRYATKKEIEAEVVYEPEEIEPEVYDDSGPVVASLESMTAAARMCNDRA